MSSSLPLSPESPRPTLGTIKQNIQLLTEVLERGEYDYRLQELAELVYSELCQQAESSPSSKSTSKQQRKCS